MKEIKFRVWDSAGYMLYDKDLQTRTINDIQTPICFTWMQFTGLKDKNGKEIYEGDVLQFSNRREWFRLNLFLRSPKEQQDILNDTIKYPCERRVIDMPKCDEWLLSNEIPLYWEVIGNIYENPEMINEES